MIKNGPQIIQKSYLRQERQPGPTLKLMKICYAHGALFVARSPSGRDTTEQQTAKRQEQRGRELNKEEGVQRRRLNCRRKRQVQPWSSPGWSLVTLLSASDFGLVLCMHSGSNSFSSAVDAHEALSRTKKKKRSPITLSSSYLYPLTLNSLWYLWRASSGALMGKLSIPKT